MQTGIQDPEDDLESEVGLRSMSNKAASKAYESASRAYESASKAIKGYGALERAIGHKYERGGFDTYLIK